MPLMCVHKRFTISVKGLYSLNHIAAIVRANQV